MTRSIPRTAMAFVVSVLALLAVLAASVDPRHASAAEPTATPEGIEFFEENIRPVLSEHCLECHGAEKQESELRLDSRAAVLEGGEIYGPAIHVGNPQESVLVKAIGHDDDDIQMPPEEKLPDAAIKALMRWVAMGAPWPEESSPGGSMSEPDLAAAWASHWAAQAITSPPLPDLQHNESAPIEWAQGPIDAFVLSQLQKEGLDPSLVADRRTLIRRATYDLTGLPPTLTEIDDFLGDESSEAFATVVDRLLASPHYGERWARYWLDVARYADTKGYVRLQEDPIYHYAYTYRDYVVRAFNEDLPYDRFIVEQLAADQLELGDDNRALAALGFLALGRRFTANKHDIIDDRIDVVTRGLLGLTVTCTRCHDHKYDAITMADYYSLYGVFASSREPPDLPIIGVGRDKPLFHGDVAEYRAQQETLAQLQAQHHEALLDSLRAATTDYLVRVLAGRQPFLVPMPPKSGEIRQTFVERWIDYIQSTSGRDDAVFSPWHALASLEASTFAEEVPDVVRSLSEAANSIVRDALISNPPTSMTDVARTYGELLTVVFHEWQAQVAADPASTALAGEASEQLRQVLYAADSPFAVTSREATADYLYDSEINKTLAEAQSKFDGWLLETGQAADRAYALVDAPAAHEPRIFMRGNPERPGPLVRRRFLRLLSDEPGTPYQHGSGRLELARAIADQDNPLTARVLVNRIWLHHFGSGLVTTPSNFGLRGDKPSHPELLDYLARSFIDEGWSIKKLHRQIMLSGTYQQESFDRPECSQVDPENRLLWRMNRRRLDFEALRDSLLSASGQLDLTVGGPPSSLVDTTNHRRTIYGTIDRLNMPGMLRTFDFPSPDLHSPTRAATTVAQQALFFLNSGFVLDCSQSLAQRAQGEPPTDPSTVINGLYLSALVREPTADETSRALAYIVDEQSWAELAQVLLLSNEFMFID